MNLQNLSDHINTNIYLNAAAELGINYELLEERVRYFKMTANNKELYILYTAFSFNDAVAGWLAKDKYATNKFLESRNIPVPAAQLFRSDVNFDNQEEVAEILAEAEKNYPVVLKPLDMSFGKGVFVNLTQQGQVETAIKELQGLKLKHILLEKFIKGKDYRILVVKGKVVDVIERVPAYVIGDGKLTLSALIDAKNTERALNAVPAIVMDGSAIEFISRSNLTIESIPAKDERIVLKGVSNISAGGETKRIEISEVAAKNIEAFEKIAKEMRLFIAGIDFISADVKVAYDETESAVNEVNSSPHPDVHYFADMALSLDAPKRVLQEYFGI